jgi:putative Ca2+/H+ antiporter (TMEM165/GDT1 family)
MITISMISLLIGAVLAQRFKVIVLIPAIAIFSGLAIIAAHADSAWSIVLLAAATTTCLQIGYFVGIGVRHALETRISSSSSSLTSAKTRHEISRASRV